MPLRPTPIASFLEAELDADLWIALMTRLPSASGTGGAELSAGGYTRIAAAAWETMVESDGTVWRFAAESVLFGTASADWLNVAGFAVYDAVDGTDPIAWGPITNAAGDPSALTVLAGDRLQFRRGSLRVGLGGAAIRIPLPQEDHLTPTNIKSAAYTAKVGERVLYNASTAPFTLRAPFFDVALGDTVGFLEVGGSTGEVTISGNGRQIVDPATRSLVTSFSAEVNGGSLEYQFDGTAWRLV